MNILKILILMSYLINGHGELLGTLQNMVVVVGDSVNLSCRSSLSPEIHWDHNNEVVYAGGRFYKSYGQSFVMNKDEATGTRTLVLRAANPSDAGLYMCREDEGRGQSSWGNLTVLESSPICQTNMKSDGYVGPNTCGIQSEGMTFTCAVSFSGNHPPRLIWRSANDGQILKGSHCESQQNKLMNCSLTLNTDPKFDGAVFICQTAETSGPQYNCSTEVTNIQYFVRPDFKPTERKVGDEISCFYASNQAVGIKWTLLQNNREAAISTNQKLKIQNIGTHWCNASYSIRNVTCFSSGPTVHVIDGASSKYAGYAVCPVIVVCLCLFATGFLVFYIRKLKRRNAKNRHDTVALLQNSETISYPEKMSCRFLIETKASQQEKALIYGLAILDNELFTISRGRREFEVYDWTRNEVDEPKRCCEVKDLVRPRNIVACNVMKCLYIEELKTEHLLSEIIRVDKDGTVLSRWQIKKDIGRISVTSHSTVIVTMRNDNALNEYTADGKLIRQIKIDKKANIVNLRHAIALNSGHFAVCHGDTSDPVHRVCIIDRSGKLIASFGEDTTDPRKQLTDPQYLASDSDGSILVVDDKRVLLFNPQLKFRRELLRDEKYMHCTFRVCLDVENGLLLVTDNENTAEMKKARGRVLVYAFNNPAISLEPQV